MRVCVFVCICVYMSVRARACAVPLGLRPWLPYASAFSLAALYFARASVTGTHIIKHACVFLFVVRRMLVFFLSCDDAWGGGGRDLGILPVGFTIAWFL